MTQVTRANGNDYFEVLSGSANIDPDVGAAIDDELNAIIAAYNAIDNTNIANSPKIAGSKVDLTSSGFLELTGGSLSGLLTHNFDGIFRLMRATGNGRIREYRGSDGAIWGISYNTYWDGAAWTGRDITDVCAALKMESDGLHYYHAVSGAAASVPSFTEVFHVNTSGVFQITDCVQTSNIQADSIPASKIDFANSEGLIQGWLLDEEVSSVDGSFTEKLADFNLVYVPANASTLGYKMRMKSNNASVTAHARLAIGATNGSDVTSTSTTYEWVASEGTLDVSAISGWQALDLDMYFTGSSGGGETSYVNKITYRFY